jgi:hypothetical protein
MDKKFIFRAVTLYSPTEVYDVSDDHTVSIFKV